MPDALSKIYYSPAPQDAIEVATDHTINTSAVDNLPNATEVAKRDTANMSAVDDVVVVERLRVSPDESDRMLQALPNPMTNVDFEIGRASCRERVSPYV